ncbi:MAG: hypothetical protein AAFZ92_11425, partial [Pseudomonadota bacterium]
LAIGMLLPGNLAALSMSVGPYTQARVAGINGIAQGIGLALGPIVSVFLHAISFSLPYFFSSIVIACLLIVLLISHQTQVDTYQSIKEFKNSIPKI